MNRYKHRKQTLKLGFLDFAYSPLYNVIEASKDFVTLQEVFGNVSKSEREKACAFVLLIGTIFKNKIVLNYRLASVRAKLCSTMDISERTYYRYLAVAIELGLAYPEGENLRLRSLTKFMSDINNTIGLSDMKHPVFLNTKETACVEIKSRKLKDFMLFTRLLVVQYQEHKNQKRIIRKIKKKKLRFKLGTPETPNYLFPVFTSKRNQGDDFVGGSVADRFNELFKFVYAKSRNIEPEDLGRRMVLDQYLSGYYGAVRLEKLLELKSKLVSNRNDFKYHKNTTKGFVDVLLERDRIKKSQNEEIDDEFIEMANSFGRVEGHEKTFNTGMTGVNRGKTLKLSDQNGNVRVLNRMNFENINVSSIYMDTESFSRFSSANIYTPEQYYRYVCSDFKLEYRIGLWEISKVLGLDKSQASRVLKKCVDAGLLSVSDRFVYLTTINDKTPKSFISSLKSEFSMLTSKDGQSTNRMVDRMVFKKGCLLFQIESGKSYKNGAVFSLSKDQNDIFYGEHESVNKRYAKLVA